MDTAKPVKSFLDIKEMFPIETKVNVTPMSDGLDNFTHCFTGIVVGYRHGYVQVRDEDNDVFEVEPCQVGLNTDDIMH